MRRLYSFIFLLFCCLLVQCQDNEPPPPPPRLEKISTKISIEVSTVYKTVVYTSSSSPTPTVYNITNTGSGGHQEQQASALVSNDQSLQESLYDDQQALKRMILIITLVGGVSLIAIFTTVVIFTRMRAKNRRQTVANDNASIHEPVLDRNSIIPSAPPAKVFLDDDNNECFECLAPEVPPPAYTPSAPPEYLLPPH